MKHRCCVKHGFHACAKLEGYGKCCANKPGNERTALFTTVPFASSFLCYSIGCDQSCRQCMLASFLVMWERKMESTAAKCLTPFIYD